MTTHACESGLEDLPALGKPPTGGRYTVLVSWVVWGIWLVMTCVVLVFIGLTGHDVPYHEDWVMVRPLTGHGSHFQSWLWAQNNEHRNPVPRLILLGLLRLTHGDFRAGMVFNALTLSAAAAAMLLLARKLRGGRIVLADAFFPLLLLHLGHSENLAMMSWQVAFVFPVIVVLITLMLLLSGRDESPAGAVVMVGCLVLLPLTGAHGLLFVPLLAFWVLLRALWLWRAPNGRAMQRWSFLAQLAGAASSLVLVTLYFLDFKPTIYTQVPMSVGQRLTTAAEILAMGLGPGTARFGAAGLVLACVLAIATFGVLVRAVLRLHSMERLRAIGILLAFSNCMVTVLAVGYGRASIKSMYGGLPLRYAILAAPLFFLMYLAWERYGYARLRRAMPLMLFGAMCLLLPLNTRSGLLYQKPYRHGMRALETDIRAGKSAVELARAHGQFLIGWWDPVQLAQRMQQLQDSGMSEFGKRRN